MLRRCVSLMLLVLAATACGDDGAEPGSDPDSPWDRTFIAQRVTEDGEPRSLASGTTLRLTFDDGDRLIASAGCNTLSGTVESHADGTLVLSTLSATEMGCPPELHEQDEWLARLFAAEPRWRLDGDTLTITSGRTEVELLDRRIVDPDRPLEGTRWEIDSIIAGPGPDGSVSSFPGDDAFLMFEEGSLEGFTGCNQLSGNYELDGNQLRFSEVTQTDVACEPAVMAGEEAVVTVVTATVTVEIEAARLWLTTEDGSGLGLVAAG